MTKDEKYCSKGAFERRKEINTYTYKLQLMELLINTTIIKRERTKYYVPHLKKKSPK